MYGQPLTDAVQKGSSILTINIYQVEMSPACLQDMDKSCVHVGIH